MYIHVYKCMYMFCEHTWQNTGWALPCYQKCGHKPIWQCNGNNKNWSIRKSENGRSETPRELHAILYQTSIAKGVR